MPVEPIPGRVAQVLMQVDVVALDLVHHDVAAGKVGIDLQLVLNRLAWCAEEKDQANTGQQPDQGSHEWELQAVDGLLFWQRYAVQFWFQLRFGLSQRMRAA